MPPHARTQRDQQAPLFPSFVRWLRLKKYQYEVTFSLYMLTPTERIVFNSILFVLISLLVVAASLYLPNHLAIICNRIWYYVHGEFGQRANSVASDIPGIVKSSVTAAYSSATVEKVVQVTEDVVRKMGEL